MKHLFLLLCLVGCRGPKLEPINHCGEICVPPDSGITLEQLERGACFPGHLDCTDAGIVCVGAVLPVEETCGDKDLDCDGLVGDPFPRDCQNICGARSSQDCDHGTWGPCKTYPQEFSQLETCNGKDDNCNNKIDEGIGALPCYDGVGGLMSHDLEVPNTGCRIGTRLCENGAITSCLNEVLPQPEICNGIDDDCNGTVDDKAGCNLQVSLTWDFYNEDLDLHLGIPVADTNFSDAGYNTPNETYWYRAAYDCFYATCVPGANAFWPNWDDGGWNDPRLNGDDIYDVGPEIITVTQPVDTHPYYVAVHWYNLPGSHTSPTGTVTVMCGGQTVVTETHYFQTEKDAWFMGAIYVDTSDGGLGCKFVDNGIVLGGQP